MSHSVVPLMYKDYSVYTIVSSFTTSKSYESVSFCYVRTADCEEK